MCSSSRLRRLCHLSNQSIGRPGYSLDGPPTAGARRCCPRRIPCNRSLPMLANVVQEASQAVDHVWRCGHSFFCLHAGSILVSLWHTATVESNGW